jgi:predicted GNAT family acetyltransferase
MDELPIAHDPAQHRFSVTLEGHESVLDYNVAGPNWIFTHTFVPDALRGRGVAAQLVQAGLTAAKAAGVKVVPQCSYVATYLDRHPEHADLRAE